MANFIRAFFIGFGTLMTGWKWIRTERQIMRLAIIPLIIDFFVLTGTFFWGWGRISLWAEQGVSWIMSDTTGFWRTLIYYPLYGLTWVVFLAFLFFLGYIVANLLAAPFNSLLAEKTLMVLKVIENEKFDMKKWLAVSAKMMWFSLLKSLLFICLGLVFFGASFLPIIGLVSSVGVLLMMAFDTADYSFELLQFTLKKRIEFFRENFPYFLGAAAILGLTLMIPLVNFLLFPIFVVGQADLIHKRLGKESKTELVHAD